MEIVHLDAGREMRGGQFQVLHLLRGLLQRGHSVRLLTHAGAPLAERARAAGIDTGLLIRSVIRSVSRTADLVHAHDARSHTLAVLGSRAPVIVARRVAFSIQRNPFSWWKYRRARHYIAVSGAVAAELERAGIPTAHVTVVYDGVEIPTHVTPYHDRPLPVSVLAPATDDPAKGSALAEEACRRAGIPLQFSVSLADDLERARIFLYLSRQEGLGSAALLGMAAGVPVVASRVGGLPEIVEHGVTGMVCDNEPVEIAQALASLAEDPALAERMALEARERALNCYSVARMVDATVSVYERVAGHAAAS